MATKFSTVIIEIQIAGVNGQKPQEAQKGRRVISTATFFSEISRRCRRMHVIDHMKSRPSLFAALVTTCVALSGVSLVAAQARVEQGPFAVVQDYCLFFFQAEDGIRGA